MSIAMLVLIHEWTDQQKRLIEALTNQFSVFVHVDKRSKIDLKEVALTGAEAVCRYKVFWGHYNQIRATLELFSIAHGRGFDRYILISGQDLPIASCEEIAGFFSGNHREYLEYFKLPHVGWGSNGGLERVEYFYPRYLIRGKSSRLSFKLNEYAHVFNNRFLKRALDVLGRRRLEGLELWGGTNWMNLSGDCVGQMLSWIRCNPWYLRRFRFTMCADEIFFHSVILAKCTGLDIVNDSLRYVDWHSGPEAPRIMRLEDLERMFDSKKLFARKFDARVDKAVISRVFEKISPDSA